MPGLIRDRNCGRCRSPKDHSDTSPELDTFAAAFAVAGENQEKAADKATKILLKRFGGNPHVEKAKVDCDHAQEVEERFRRDFDGLDFN
jgi:hypothetical protein